jgi:hypothetical protein
VRPPDLRRIGIRLGVVAAVAGLAAAAPTSADDARTWRLHGLVFGDYYWFAAHHDPRWRDQQGFWLRRAYLGYDQDLGERLSLRLRLEMNSSGTLEDEDLTPYVKDAYLTFTYAGRQQLRLGIQPSLTFDAEEQFWGLRYVEKTPADLYRIDSSRDLGLTLRGPVPLEGLSYAAQVGNESGSGSETDEYKVVRLLAAYERARGVRAEAVFNYAARPEDQDRLTAKVFLGWRGASFRVGGQYLWQERRSGSSEVPRTAIRILSAFGALELVPKKATVFARWDDVAARQGTGGYVLGLPGASGIDYLPISPAAPFRAWILGFEWHLHPAVRVGPNVEWVTYRAPVTGPPIEDDVVPRITFFWSW